MTDLTPESRAELEAARRATGEFGPRERSEPELELDEGNAYRDASTPLTVTLRLERWNSRDEAEEVGRVQIDARGFFDARSLVDIETIDADDNDQDWILHEATEAGLFAGHDGPFTVELPEDLADYFAHRADNAMTAPYPSARESIAVLTMEKRQEVLAEADRLLTVAGEHGVITRPNNELFAGDVLVQGTNRLCISDAYPSSSMPGFVAVETSLGVLYLDPEQSSTIEA